jgi:hypothetical protein
MHRVVVGIACLAAFASSAMAEVVEFVVDPALTRWSVRGAYFREGEPQGDFAPQFPESDLTSLTGVLRVDLTPSTIQFLPGSALNAAPQPLPQQPGVNGASGVAPADYGVASSTLSAPVPVFAVRDFGFSLSSEPIELRGIQFNESLRATINARLDYDLGMAAGSYPFTDWQQGFDNDNVGTITTNGLVQTIRLQNYLGQIFALQSPADSFIEWSGPIVATRVIPEPTGLLLAVVALWSGAAFARACQTKRRARVALAPPVSIGDQ